MQNPKFQIRSNFDNLYFHAKSQVKSIKYHTIKCDLSLKSYDYEEFKLGAWNFFDNLYFHPKSQVNRKKIKIKRGRQMNYFGRHTFTFFVVFFWGEYANQGSFQKYAKWGRLKKGGGGQSILIRNGGEELSISCVQKQI